ncbi:hypothetical protein NDU88_001644 [Pleurodeles waltl]|uniref:Myb/SANT-like DNA-binding domain-containing protein n=1 Tax=Pleurodeles waltl TaxID=8319 RepID=A0AAV7S9C1_PLEWA|nr:hypothetical protein NDU88_001644 [Pleurodeles waltl]
MRALVLSTTPHYRQLYHTGAASNAVKRELWQQIRQRVASEGIVMRTVGQLKVKYRQMRRPVMQKLSQYWSTVPTPTAGSPVSLGLTDMENLIACSVVPETIDGVSDSDDRGPGDADTQRTATLWKEMDLTLRKEQKATHSYRGLETHLYAYLQIQTLLNAGS